MAAAKECYQRFSPRQEKYICDWIRYIEGAVGKVPANKQITEFARKHLPKEDSKPLGVNWMTGFLRRNPEIKSTLFRSTHIASGLLHDSEFSFHWNKALRSQLEIFDFAKNHLQWSSASQFDFQGATQTYQTLKCSIMHFNDNDLIHGGRILRKAFLTLAKELAEASPNVIQDICLNIVGALVRWNFPEIATLMLQHCSELFRTNNERHLYYVFFECLSRVLCKDKAHLDHYLWQLTRLYADELENNRSSNDRSSIQAKRRHHLIVRDSKTAATTEDACKMINSSESLLTCAISELGSLHDKTLRIENEALRMQHYVGRYQDDYITRIDHSIDRITEYYASGQRNEPFEGWDMSHQSAYLRYLERKFDYYKHFEDQERAIEVAGYILEKDGYQTERWIVFSLQVKSWLKKIGHMGWYLHYRQKRLMSSYYHELKERFAKDEDLETISRIT